MLKLHIFLLVFTHNLLLFQAESMAGEMIASERLHGYIDQTNGVLHFEDANPMRVWDGQILGTLEQVNKVSDMIVAQHPQFATFLS